MKKTILTLLSLIMVFILVACSSGTDNTTTEGESQVLRVGMEVGYAPFNWSQTDDSNGGVAIENSPEFANGYDVQIAKRIADGLGKELVIVKTEWDGLPPAVISGKIDMIIAGMSPTADRAKQIDFSEPYYESDLVLVVAEDGQYADATSMDDFNGARVVAQLNTFHDTVVNQIEGVNHMTAMSDFPTMRVAVESGKADAYVAERPEAEAAQAAGIGLKMISLDQGFETNPEDTQISVGLQKGSELVDQVNEIISGISEEERIEIMSQAQNNQ